MIANKDLPPRYTTQQLFNKSVLGVLKQGEQSMDDGDCRYRGCDGAKCAIGFLIEDEFYEHSLEGNGIGGAFVEDAVEKSIQRELLYRESMVLHRLQSAHDRHNVEHLSFVDAFEEEAVRIAKKAGLSTAAITNWRKKHDR